VSNETTTTVAGNLTADPELRFTGSGVPVAHFTVASTSRVQDNSSGAWRAYETDDGQKRSTIELVADEVSVSLRHAIALPVPSRSRTNTDRPATPLTDSPGRALP